jgi:hypothetical protein
MKKSSFKTKSKYILLFLIGFFAWDLLVYFSCAFYSWKLMPPDWSEGTRLCYFVCSIIGIFFAGILTVSNEASSDSD